MLDLHMPGLDGMDLARALRERLPVCPPLVMLSAQPAEADHDGLFDAWTVKPAKQSTLLRTLARAVALPDASAPTRSEDHEMSVSPLRILLAEDNVVTQEPLRTLSALGYRADLVADGTEAVKAVLRIGYDVVLMDIQMPVLDGHQATRRIRSRLPAGRRQPYVIALTANALEADERHALDAGMDGYLTKPLRRDALAAALRPRCPAPTACSWSGVLRPTAQRRRTPRSHRRISACAGLTAVSRDKTGVAWVCGEP